MVRGKQEVLIIPKVAETLVNSPKRHKVIIGGRGKGATHSIARIFLMKGMQQKHFVLCIREIQKTLKDSVKKTLEDVIDYYGWHFFYKSSVNEITGVNGTRFIFMGMQDKNSDNVKSIEGISLCWVAEGQSMSRNSIMILRPTVRDDNSEIWWDYNPRFATDPVYIDYPPHLQDDPSADVCFLTWEDNPWFPESLKIEKAADYKRNEQTAIHIWEGKVLDDGDFTICPASLVTKAFNREIPGSENSSEVVVGADIAHQGGDKIIFYKRIGRQVIERYERSKQSATKTARDLIAFAGHPAVKVNIDNGSVGAAVADILEEKEQHTERINFGGKPVNLVHYENTVTEMYFYFRDILPTISFPRNAQLEQQLIGRQYEWINGSRGYEVMRVETKKTFRERTGIPGSPDDADALVLCYYDPDAIQPAGELSVIDEWM